MALWDYCNKRNVAIEEIDINVIRDICQSQKQTLKSFASIRSIIKGFYQYLKRPDIAAQIGEFKYENKIKYFSSIDDVWSCIEAIAKEKYDSGEIHDEHQYDTKKLVILLYALGLTPSDILPLKWADYDTENSRLKVSDKYVDLPPKVNAFISMYRKSDGYLIKYSETAVKNVVYIEGESLIKLVRKNAVMNINTIYRINKGISEDFGFDYVDIRKSYDMWSLFQVAGYSEIDADLINRINWNKIRLCIVNNNYSITESEIRDFLSGIQNDSV